MTRQEALHELYTIFGYGFYNKRVDEALKMAIKALEQKPKRGKWIAIDDTHSQCMECGAIFCITSSNEWEVNYCPNCGARVEVEEE